MLRLLTDEQISPAVADAVRRMHGELEITALCDWHAGHMLSADDALVLAEARREALTLASYDLRTLPVLLRALAEQGIDHGGVVLVDEASIRQVDVGGLAGALCALWVSQGRLDWTNRVVFLRRGAS